MRIFFNDQLLFIRLILLIQTVIWKDKKVWGSDECLTCHIKWVHEVINVAGEAKHMVEDDHYSQEKLVKGSYVVLQTDSVCTLWLNIIDEEVCLSDECSD